MNETLKEETKSIPKTTVYGITQQDLRHRILVYNSLVTSDPYRNYNKPSPWNVIGSFGDWKKDISMFTSDRFCGAHICKAIKLKEGDELKFRCNHSWLINLGLSKDNIPGSLIHLSRNGQNIRVEESGLYDINFDPISRTARIFPSRVSLDDIPEGLEMWYDERNKIMDEAFRLRSLRKEWIRFSTAFPEEYKLVVELPEIEDYDGKFVKYKDRLERDWKNLNKAYVNSNPERK